MNDQAHAASFTRTLRLKVRAESYPWLNAAAVEVNAADTRAPWLSATPVLNDSYGVGSASLKGREQPAGTFLGHSGRDVA